MLPTPGESPRDPDGKPLWYGLLPGVSFRGLANRVTIRRPICVYPLVARYKGHGSINDARSFVCSTHF